MWRGDLLQAHLQKGYFLQAQSEHRQQGQRAQRQRGNLLPPQVQQTQQSWCKSHLSQAAVRLPFQPPPAQQQRGNLLLLQVQQAQPWSDLQLLLAQQQRGDLLLLQVP